MLGDFYPSWAPLLEYTLQEQQQADDHHLDFHIATVSRSAVSSCMIGAAAIRPGIPLSTSRLWVVVNHQHGLVGRDGVAAIES